MAGPATSNRVTPDRMIALIKRNGSQRSGSPKSSRFSFPVAGGVFLATAALAAMLLPMFFVAPHGTVPPQTMLAAAPPAQPAPAQPMVRTSPAAHDSALDAPAVPDRPTVRTELRRALDASSACEGLMNNLPWTTEGNRDVLNYYGCMNKIVSDSAQSKTYSEAFELGMYFERTVRSSIIIHVIEKRCKW